MKKVVVYAICKNEEKFVDRWMDSMKEADLIVVTDTGSTDGTVERLREKGAVVHVEEIKPWRFDVARNRSLDHVPEDADICVCTDLDELFEPGWREKLERTWCKYEDAVYRQARYTYNWSLKPDGTPGVQFIYSKVHTRQGFRWRFPIHEWLEFIGEDRFRQFDVDGMVLNHYPDASKSRSSYLPLLEMAVEEDPDDDRMTYYLGREYFYHNQFDKAIKTLMAHLELPSAKWNEERGASMRWIAQSHFKMNRPGEGSKWYFKAMAETGHMREPYVEFARCLYPFKDWPMINYLIDEALKITKRSPTYTNQDYTWDHTPYDYGSLACFYLGQYDKALEYAQKAVALNPGDKRLRDNLRLVESRKALVKGGK